VKKSRRTTVVGGVSKVKGLMRRARSGVPRWAVSAIGLAGGERLRPGAAKQRDEREEEFAENKAESTTA
jgi:hypothetical protein